MNDSDTFSAELPYDVFSQITMELVDDLKQKSGQIDNTATIVGGVGIGMLMSAAIVCAFRCIAMCCPLLDRRIRNATHTGTAAGPALDIDLDADADDHQCNTEGAYRSESESSDDGEAVKASKEAQMRSRKSGFV